MKIYFDMPNVLWRSLLAGKDTENGIEVPDPIDPTKKVWINSATYGYDNAVAMMYAELTKYRLAPKDMVMVFEGYNATALRRQKAPTVDYKGSRGKRPEEAYAAFKQLAKSIEKLWLELGASAVSQDGVEADDVLAWLAKHSEEDCIVWSYDGDLARLIGTNEYGAQVHVANGESYDKNPFGPFSPKLITLYKATAGDPSDAIKGAHGFGDAAFLKVLAEFGEEGMFILEKLIQDKELFKVQEDVDACPVLKKLLNSEQAVYDSYKLASLYPEAIDRLNNPLDWRFGMVRDLQPGDDRRLERWYGRRTLVHGANFQRELKRAVGQWTEIVSLDLETTVPQEAEDWLEVKKKRDTDADGVDVFGSEIASCGITVGDNLQHTFYFTHRHQNEPGIEQLSIDQMCEAIETITRDRTVVIHNAGGFELPVLGRHFGDAWKTQENPSGLLQRVICTALMASYVDENLRSNLKFSAKHYLNYDQQTYQETTELTDEPHLLPPGGKLLQTFPATEAVQGEDIPECDWQPARPYREKRRYKMDELTASHVFGYGTDDTIVTAALYNHWKLRMQLEHTWKVYLDVEIDAMYLNAWRFIQGLPISLEKLSELEKHDDETYDAAWGVIRQYLIKQGWEGTEPPTYQDGTPLTPAQIKEAFEIVAGRPLVTQVRTLSKLVKLIEAEGEDVLATVLEAAIASNEYSSLARLVRSKFSGEPQINFDSPKQMTKLMYEVMRLPIEVRNKPTDKMRAEGVYEGTPKTDDLAIQYAKRHADAEVMEVLNALGAVKMVMTRRKMFYSPYRTIRHWEDGLVHPAVRQSATNTRRFTGADPNLMQVPKHPKATGEPARLREVFVAHKPARKALIVSMDFSSQELGHIAEQSQDPNMLACFDLSNPKDMHAMTGLGIFNDLPGVPKLSLDEFMAIYNDDSHELYDKVKKARTLGKKVNFTTEFGAQARKLAQTMLVSEEEAQRYIDAKLEAFPVVAQWKERVIREAQETGYSYTALGARRHLRSALLSEDRYTASKADRQAVNFRIQSSSAEQTKLAMGKMWRSGLFFEHDAVFYFPVHDELVASVAVDDVFEFIPKMHAAMIAKYANMKVQIQSSISIGWDFGQQIEIGNKPTREAIQSALETLGAVSLAAA